MSERADSRIDYEDISSILNSAILCPTNKDYEEINEDLLAKLQGEITEYHSNDTLVEDNKIGIENITEEFLNSLTISSLPKNENLFTNSSFFTRPVICSFFKSYISTKYIYQNY